MLNRNYTDTVIWLHDVDTAVSFSQFYSEGVRYYKFNFGGLYGGVITPCLSVLEGIREAADAAIEAYKQHEIADALEAVENWAVRS